MEGVMWTFAMVLFLIVLLFAVGALMTAGVRQIVDEIESQESHCSDETALGSDIAPPIAAPLVCLSNRTVFRPKLLSFAFTL